MHLSLIRAKSQARELGLGMTAMRALVGPGRCLDVSVADGDKVRVDLSIGEAELLYHLWLARERLAADAKAEMQRLVAKSGAMRVSQ